MNSSFKTKLIGSGLLRGTIITLPSAEIIDSMLIGRAAKEIVASS